LSVSAFFFNCNFSGAGNYIRVGNKLGFGPASTFLFLPTTVTEQYTQSTIITSVNRYKIIISDTGSSTLYINGIMQTIVSGSYTPNYTGTYIGFQGDSVSSGYYGYFSNLTIT
jgi:hypothetical protein